MTRPRSSFAAGAAVLAAGLVAATLGSIPWLAGAFTVVEPCAMQLALAAAAAGGIVAIGAAALARRTRSVPRVAVLSLGLLAAASSPAFVALMARQPPAEPRTASGPAKARPTTGKDRLRILQLNAHHGYPDSEGRLLPPVSASDRPGRAGRLEAAIARLQPDIVLLQEAWCTVAEGCLADRLAAGLNLHAVYGRANGSLRWLGFEEGSAILSRFPVADPRVWPLAPNRDAFERRIALTARIDHPRLPSSWSARTSRTATPTSPAPRPKVSWSASSPGRGVPS